MTTRHDAEARLSRAIDKENAALAGLEAVARDFYLAEYFDGNVDGAREGMQAAAKKWTNAYHELSRAQKAVRGFGLRAVRRED